MCHGRAEDVTGAYEENVGASLGLDARMLGRVRRQLRLSSASGALASARQVTPLFDLLDCPWPERSRGCNPGDHERHPVVQSADDPELRLR